MENGISKKKTAVAIFSFNRPKYLKQVLNSMEQNLDLDGMDFYMFQDGAINKFSKRRASNERDIKNCIDLWEMAKLPNKVLIRRKENVGIGISQFEANCILFEGLNYEQVIFLEDDLVLSKNYLRLIKVLLDQFRQDRDVGAVTCHGHEFSRVYSREQKLEILYKLKMGRPHLWGWAMWKDRWLKIKPSFLKYFEFVKDVDNKLRPHDKIRFFFESEGVNIYPTTGWDGGMYYAFFMNGFFVLNTWINRGKYIGESGQNMRPEIFQTKLFSSMKLDEFSRDELVVKFDDFDRKKFWEVYNKYLTLSTA